MASIPLPIIYYYNVIYNINANKKLVQLKEIVCFFYKTLTIHAGVGNILLIPRVLVVGKKLLLCMKVL